MSKIFVLKMDVWFEIVILIYGLIYLLFMFVKIIGQIDTTPELTEEIRHKIYS